MPALRVLQVTHRSRREYQNQQSERLIMAAKLIIRLKQCTFRPTPENAKQLEFADELGINRSAVINLVLTRHLPAEIRHKATRIQSTLKTVKLGARTAKARH